MRRLIEHLYTDLWCKSASLCFSYTCAVRILASRKSRQKRDFFCWINFLGIARASTPFWKLTPGSQFPTSSCCSEIWWPARPITLNRTVLPTQLTSPHSSRENSCKTWLIFPFKTGSVASLSCQTDAKPKWKSFALFIFPVSLSEKLLLGNCAALHNVQMF